MTCEHSHDNRASGDHAHSDLIHTHGATSGRMLWISLSITLAFVILETIAGYSADSLALLSDAGHNLSDALALGLAAYAIRIAKRPSNATKTFGYHRVTVLTALVNAVTLVVIAFGILSEAVKFVFDPQSVHGPTVIWVGALAFLMNTVIAYLVRRRAHEDLNTRAAFIHMAGDAACSLGVVLSGFVVQKTGWVFADPLVSALIAVFILLSAWDIIKEAGDILLEAAPRNLDLELLLKRVREVPRVADVHDVHVWAVSDKRYFLSCHVVVADTDTMEMCDRVVAEISQLLARDFNIAHATIQTESSKLCAPAEKKLFCN